MQTIAASTGADMAGLDFRLKTETSMERKIVSDADALQISEKEAADRIADGLRYTATFDAANYTAGVQNFASQMRDEGYSFAKVKNTWDPPDSPYRGINTQVVSPDGYKFEVQFHTPESFRLKNEENHHDFEQYRLMDPNTDHARELYTRMSGRSEQLDEPQGAAGLTDL